jgi:dimethylargininase
VFVEDAVVVFGDLAVLCRAGAESRRGEAPTVREAVAATGLEVAEIVAPGTLDGGDVLKIGSTVYVGASSRTNADGIAQLTALLAPRGWQVVAVPVERVLHLKSGVTALPDGTVVGFEPLVDDPAAFPTFEACPRSTVRLSSSSAPTRC